LNRERSAISRRSRTFSSGVYVQRQATGFEVKELKGGTSRARFTYRVVAKRKGFETVRLEAAVDTKKMAALKETKNYECLSKQMVEKIDTEQGRRIYPQRLAIAEPVFANIRINKRLDRSTLRGKVKVNIQWLIYCLVHNIEKILNYGLAYV
jgi:hypothetical protein